jgi:hypothetical protein
MKKLAFYGLAALLAGCGPLLSLHPLFTKETVVFDEKLLGTWVGDVNESQTTLEFARLEETAAKSLPAELKDVRARAYRLTLTDKGHHGSFIACLIKLQDRLFLDLYPDKFPWGEQDPEKMELPHNIFFFVPVHMFVRVDAIGDQLKIRRPNGGGFKKLLEAQPNAVRHEWVNGYPLLTASPEQLQAFVAKYADDDRLFLDVPLNLTRKSK